MGETENQSFEVAPFVLAARGLDALAEENYNLAADYFQRALDKAPTLENVAYELGCLYDKGLGVDIDKTRAFELFLLSAENHCAKAQEKVAQIYEQGVTIERDIAAARIWRKKASRQREIDAKPLPSLSDSIRKNISENNRREGI